MIGCRIRLTIIKKTAAHQKGASNGFHVFIRTWLRPHHHHHLARLAVRAAWTVCQDVQVAPNQQNQIVQHPR